MRRLDGMNVHVNATKEYRKGPSETRGEILPMTGSQGVRGSNPLSSTSGILSNYLRILQF